ncbi:hypothetical protein Taro_033815 [Colocasia esculenta]|uniref:HD domain-containing protein n=1 Tax=Colocasia esculenta TaxID=4460 RepID=A0A843VYZ3_COLES|nr:hypothetical protein [Colocasia esculenta]
MGGGRAAALLSRSSSTSSALHPAVLSHHLGFRPLLSLRPFRGRAGASSVRMASDAAPQKDSAAAAVSSAGAPGSSSAASPSSTSPSSAVDFLTLCHRLKTTKRAGWVRHGIREPESVADHMYRMGVMALISSDLPGVDRERCIKMAICLRQTTKRAGWVRHGIQEPESVADHMYWMGVMALISSDLPGVDRESFRQTIVGDITPADGVPKLEKSGREQEALDHMCSLLGGGSRAKEIHDLWMEYEDNSSLEAKLVKDFDKVEMILQALEYETGMILLQSLHNCPAGPLLLIAILFFAKSNS